jgi:Zn-dependent M16 (insulinase) family peptidase
MRPGDLDRVRRESEELLAAQRAPDPPEALASLPRLTPEDVPRDVMTVPTTERTNGVRHLEHALPTNGVVYVGFAFDVSHLPEALQPYVTLLGEALTGMGAAGLDYGRMATRTARVTGGVEAVVSAWDRLDGGVEQRLVVRSKALARNAGQMIAILGDILTAGDLDDTDRLSAVLVARRNRLRATVAPQGHLFSWRSAAAGLSLSRRRDELWQGGAHLRMLSGITSGPGEDPEAIVATLRRVREAILTRTGAIASAAGDERDLVALRPDLDRVVEALGARPGGDDEMRAAGTGADPIGDGTPRSGIALPGDVCYVSRVIPVPRADHPMAGSLHVLAHYLRGAILYKRIRVEGGAYGGMAHYDDVAGHLVFMSYRDPNLERTLEIYDGCLDELATHPLDDETVRRTVIGALGRLERPLSPQQKTQRALRWHLGGPTEAERRALKAAVLEVDAAAMRRVAEEIVRPAFVRARESAYAPRARLEAANERLDPPFRIEGLDG